MSILTEEKLATTVLNFQSRFNNHDRVKKLLKKWNRLIFLEATDTERKYTMIVSDQKMTDVEEGLMEDHSLNDDTRIHLQADEEILIQIFSGEYNPATAHIDGALAVYSSDQDKVKLEAIAMVIWGL